MYILYFWELISSGFKNQCRRTQWVLNKNSNVHIFFQFFINHLIAFNNSKILVCNHHIIYQSCYYFPSTLVYSFCSGETYSLKVCLFHNYNYLCNSQSHESFSYTLIGHEDGLVPPSQSSFKSMSIVIGRGNFNTFRNHWI
jgi:hypothetical protein